MNVRLFLDKFTSDEDVTTILTPYLEDIRNSLPETRNVEIDIESADHGLVAVHISGHLTTRQVSAFGLGSSLRTAAEQAAEDFIFFAMDVRKQDPISDFTMQEQWG